MDNPSPPINSSESGLPTAKPHAPETPVAQSQTGLSQNTDLPVLPTTEGPIVGYNDELARLDSAPKTHKRLWIILGSVLAVLILGSLLYFLILPNNTANSYLKNIKPAYQKQNAQLPQVYDSLSKQVFVSDSGSTGDDNDLNEVSGLIQTALANTKALEDKNHLSLLPGAKLTKKASEANRSFQSMSQYISDSQDFLNEYKNLVTYIKTLLDSGQPGLEKLENDYNKLGASTNATQLISASKTTETDLASLLGVVKNLTPTKDVEDYQGNLLGSLESQYNGIQNLLAALNGDQSINLESTLSSLSNSATRLDTVIGTNPTENLPTSSDLHSKITKLKSEHPF